MDGYYGNLGLLLFVQRLKYVLDMHYLKEWNLLSELLNQERVFIQIIVVMIYGEVFNQPGIIL